MLTSAILESCPEPSSARRLLPATGQDYRQPPWDLALPPAGWKTPQEAGQNRDGETITENIF